MVRSASRYSDVIAPARAQPPSSHALSNALKGYVMQAAAEQLQLVFVDIVGKRTRASSATSCTEEAVADPMQLPCPPPQSEAMCIPLYFENSLSTLLVSTAGTAACRQNNVQH